MSPAPGFRLITADEVEEVGSLAWQNVAAHSSDFSPLSLLEGLVDVGLLRPDQLQFRSAVRYLTSAEARSLVDGGRDIVRRLAQTTQVQIEDGRVPAGLVDWPTTILRRVTTQLDASMMVLRRNEVHRDLPENRLFRYLLHDIAVRAGSMLAESAREGWQRAVEGLGAEAARLSRHPILREIPAELSLRGYRAALASRAAGFGSVARAYELYDSLFRRGHLDELRRLFAERVLVPRLEDRLFELLVLFRLMTRLEGRGAKRVALRLIGRGTGPIFVYKLGSHRLVVYFQGMPAAIFERSLYRKWMRRAGWEASARRPDIVVTVTKPGETTRLFLLEAKCSIKPGVLRNGAFQLLGYCGDYQLTPNEETSLVVVSYNGAPRSADWRHPTPLGYFRGSLTDVDGLDLTLAALGLP